MTLESGMPLGLRQSVDADARVIQLEAGGDKEFRFAKAKLSNLQPGEWQRQVVLDNGSVYVRWEDWLELIVSWDGQHVTVGRLSGIPAESLDAYIANFVVCAALIQQGEEPLHSTVVSMGARAVGFLGPSGAGKSTLAAFFLGRGARLVTDDMLRITFEDETAVAQPGPARLKLMHDSATLYLQNGRYRGRWDTFAQKCIFEPNGYADEGCRPAPLAALFWLGLPEDDAADQGVMIKRLEGLELFQTISASTMNSGLVTTGRLERQLRFASRVGRLLPVYQLTYPRRHNVFRDVAAAINQLIQ